MAYHPYGYGRGRCWNPGGTEPRSTVETSNQGDEIHLLEENANFLREELGRSAKRLEELKKVQTI